jgi:hypothetical protein
MRLLPMLLALPLFALQAHAQTAPPLQAAPAPDVSAPAATAPAAPKHHRMTAKERFAQANVAHDGHLTLQEAQSGYPTIARHFTEIDADKKGYVTEADIANWHKLERAMHHAGKDRADEGLRPRHAFQQGVTQPRGFNTSTSSTIQPMTESDAPAAGQQATEK